MQVQLFSVKVEFTSVTFGTWFKWMTAHLIDHTVTNQTEIAAIGPCAGRKNS